MAPPGIQRVSSFDLIEFPSVPWDIEFLFRIKHVESEDALLQYTLKKDKVLPYTVSLMGNSYTYCTHFFLHTS